MNYETFCNHCGKKNIISIEQIKSENNNKKLPLEFIVEDIIKDLKHGTRFQILSERLLGITIHQSATEKVLAGSNPYGYAAHHVDFNEWNNIAYHRVNQPDGVIYKTLKINHKGNHAGYRGRSGDENRQFLGICFSGNFDSERMEEIQYKAGIASIVDLYEEGRDAGLMPDIDKLIINTHTSINPHKSCPGKLFPFEQMKNEAFELLKLKYGGK